MVIEDWEMPQMRDWFGLAPDAPVPWPLVARMREPVGVSVLDMSSQPAAGHGARGAGAGRHAPLRRAAAA